MIKVKDLQDQILGSDRSFLYCQSCGSCFSGNKGDYFLQSEDHVFKHCRRNMVLAVPRHTMEIVRK